MADFISKYNSGLDLENDIASKASQTSVDKIANGTTKTNAQSLQSKPISTTAPTTGQMLVFNGTQYVPTTFIESGSNASGWYMKFPDGTLKQWSRGEATISSAGGFTKGFPILFIDNTYACLANSLNSKISIACDCVAAGYSNFWCDRVDGVSIIGTTVKYSFEAIGRWKA